MEALTPPSQLSEWHLLNIESSRTIQAVIDLRPKDDVIGFANFLLIAVASAALEESLSEVAARLPEDVRQQMIEAGCIDPEDVPDDDEEVPDDHGNDIDDATAIRVGADVRGALDYDGDIDYFRFQAEQGQSYQIDVALGTLHDSTVDLYDSDGWLMDSNDDYGDTLASRLYWNAPSSGERYVAVEGYGIGTYTLTVSLSDVIDDHADSEVSATAIRVGADVRGALDYDGDIDYFRFQAEAGRGYQIDVALGTLDDSIVELYDGDGSFLDTNDDRGGTSASRLFWVAPSSGERYIAVVGYGVGTYTLTVSIVDDHGDTAELTQTTLPPPPAFLGLDPFYEKYVDADGIPIVSSSKTPDEALLRAKHIIDEMLALRSDLRTTIAELGIRVAIMADSEVTTDIPEHSDLYEAFPGTDWNTRARGLGATLGRPAVSGAEENLLCYGDDAYRNEDIFVHEFAHTVLQMGVEQQPKGTAFRTRLQTAYEDALEAGLWTGTYASENADEYWAEGVQSWFGLNDPAGYIHNEIDTRNELKEYDPVLTGLIEEVFGDTDVLSSCHRSARIQGVVVGPDGEPLEGIGLWAWQGTGGKNGYARTGLSGVFDIRVPDGSFTLDVYAAPDSDCSFVGWYGPGGFTKVRRHATQVKVTGTDVTGVKIILPDEPEKLPRIEWCS